MMYYRPSLMTIFLVSFGCLWIETRVTASPVLLPNEQDDDHSVVPPDAANQNVTIEDFELGEPFSVEELSGNVSMKAPSGKTLEFLCYLIWV